MDHELSWAHRGLVDGRVVLPAIGAVVAGPGALLAWVVRDGPGREVEAVSSYLRDRMLGDVSALTCRGYAYDLPCWFRIVWTVDAGWEQAAQAETATLVAGLRSAGNPQRRRRDGPAPGPVNRVTGKPVLAAGYAPATIGHNLTAVHGFDAFHLHFGRGPVVNLVPENTARREALAHRSLIESVPRYRQRVPRTEPRAIPDRMFDELFERCRPIGTERSRRSTYRPRLGPTNC